VRVIVRPVGRFLTWLFLKIEEPRFIRIIQFALYVTMVVIGGLFLAALPRQYEGILGLVLAQILGWAITGGGLLGAIAVLPGVWWLERLGIISLWTGLGMFVVVALTLRASPIGVGIAVALVLALGGRWLTVREYQVAPGR
jgi:hypothetical protein